MIPYLMEGIMADLQELKKIYEQGNKNTLKKNLLFTLAALGILSGLQVANHEYTQTLEKQQQKVEADAISIVDDLLLKHVAIQNMQMTHLGCAITAALPHTDAEIKKIELKARQNEKYDEAQGLRQAFSIRRNQINKWQAQEKDIMPLVYSMEKNAGRTLDSYKVVSTLPVFEQKLRAFITKSK